MTTSPRTLHAPQVAALRRIAEHLPGVLPPEGTTALEAAAAAGLAPWVAVACLWLAAAEGLVEVVTVERGPTRYRPRQRAGEAEGRRDA